MSGYCGAKEEWFEPTHQLDAASRDVRLDLLVEFEVVLLRQDVDLGAGRLLPFADPLVELFVLLSADQLGVDRDALELAGQFCGIRRSPAQASITTPAETPASSLFISTPPMFTPSS